MFIGAINRYMRAVLEQTAERWRGLPVVKGALTADFPFDIADFVVYT